MHTRPQIHTKNPFDIPFDSVHLNGILHVSALLGQGHCQESRRYFLYYSNCTAKGIVIDIQSSIFNL